MPDAPLLGANQESQTRRRRLRRAFSRSAGAPERACRASSAPARHGGNEDARDGLRRRRQAVAPEGHGPCTRRLQPLADLDRRWRGIRPAAALVHLQGQPQGAARGAAQRAVAARRARLAGDPRRERVRRAEDEPGAFDLLDDWAQDGPTLVVLAPEESSAALSFRNLRGAVLSAADVGVTDLLAAASLLVSQTALPSSSARREPSRARCGRRGGKA